MSGPPPGLGRAEPAPDADCRPERAPLLAVLIPSMAFGGAERVVLTLVRGFVERGFAVDLLLVHARGPLLREVPPEVRVVPLRGGRVATSLPSLVGYLRRNRPTALLSHLDAMNLIAVVARGLAGVATRVAVTTHTALNDYSRFGSVRDRVVNALVPLVYRRADAVVGVSEGVVAELKGRIKVPAPDLSVIYNPVTTDELLAKAREPEGGSGEATPAVPAGSRFLLSVGRLTPVKNQGLLIDAFANVAAEFDDLCLVILGDGPERDRLLDRVERHGLAGRVIMPGYEPAPWAYYRSASAFVLSSDCEGLGNVLVEALAFGCPVVSTDCPVGPAEVLADGAYGKLVPTNDAAALARAIRETLANPPSPSTLRNRALDFRADRAVADYLDVLFPRASYEAVSGEEASTQ